MPLTPENQNTITPKRQLVVNANYELFVLALTMLQVTNSVLWLLLRGQDEAQVVLLITASISLFLIVDSIYRWLRAPSRRRFLFAFHGWLLWLGSLPIPFIAILRLLWYRQSISRMRRSEVGAMVDVVVEKRAQSTLLGAILAAIVVLEAAAILILGAESKSQQANIQTAGDAVWWTVVTVATVGYGDKYPVTPAGRVIGGFVMVVGVALFSVLTSFLAQWFVRSRQAKTAQTADAAAQAPDTSTAVLLARIDALVTLLEKTEIIHQADTGDLHTRLAQMENRLALYEAASELPPETGLR
jgi:voltage-gated potassium channel